MGYEDSESDLTASTHQNILQRARGTHERVDQRPDLPKHFTAKPPSPPSATEQPRRAVHLKRSPPRKTRTRQKNAADKEGNA